MGDFIENGPSGKISETTAQNIANFFSPMKELKDNISTFMTNTLGIPVTANISFERGVIDQIFGDESLTDMPLNFYSIYSTCLLYTSPSPRDGLLSRMPSSA